MAQAQPSSKLWQKFNQLDQKLKTSIQKLSNNEQKDLGLSKNFLEEVHSQQEALELCDKAMAQLADDYVANLTAFQEATDPLQALDALNKAETIWRREAAVIKHFDAGQEEIQFLNEMRAQTLIVLEEKLEKASDQFQRNNSNSNKALCMGIMLTIDYVFEEIGMPQFHPSRQRMQKIIAAFDE